jgi:hypothetical protein
MEKLLKLSIIALIFLSLPIRQASALSISSIGIANYFPVNSSHVEDGDIIISNGKGYFLSDSIYDPRVSGVVTTTPAIVLRSNNDKNTYPVVYTGMVNVKISGVNGSIKRGDFITTSTIPGTGMKATKTGYVIGTAENDATFTKSGDIQLVTVALNFHFLQLGSPVSSSLLDVFSLSRLAAYEQPLRVFQYVMASIILLASFVFGFLIFAKVVNTGVEALGRNPLAGKMIQLSILFNVILIIVIIMTGVSLAYIVVRL